MKAFCFTVDDNIRFLKELTESGAESIFDHPYPAMYRRLHDDFGVSVQLNLFYELGDFDLSMVTDAFKSEWEENSDWLKLSFHSRLENEKPYVASGYDEVFCDCQNVHREILRFASPSSLATTTTVHYCRATSEGLGALYDNGVRGLLGLYGTDEAPRSSYQSTEDEDIVIRNGGIAERDGMSYAGIDIVMNDCTIDEILERLRSLSRRSFIKVMIHEQYFYPDYVRYQKNFEDKLREAFTYLKSQGYESCFFQNLI